MTITRRHRGTVAALRQSCRGQSVLPKGQLGQPSPRRLPPGARRRQIIDAGRRLISERGDAEISTADVARAAGVTRALVHHYFRGIDELLDAVTQQLVASLQPGSLGAGTEIAAQQRVPHNVAAFLDMIEANRGVWLAAMAARTGTKGATPSADLLREAFLERILANNADLITDTPWARLCLAGYVAFSEAIARRWLLGQASRQDAQRALTDTLLHLLLETIPGTLSTGSGPPGGGSPAARAVKR